MKIADITIKNGICLAPLAGVSDRTFRAMARRFGAEYTVSEMVSAKALCYEQLCKRPVTEERTKTAPLAAEAGATVLVAGSYVFSDEMEERVEFIKSL